MKEPGNQISLDAKGSEERARGNSTNILAGVVMPALLGLAQQPGVVGVSHLLGKVTRGETGQRVGSQVGKAAYAAGQRVGFQEGKFLIMTQVLGKSP